MFNLNCRTWCPAISLYVESHHLFKYLNHPDRCWSVWNTAKCDECSQLSRWLCKTFPNKSPYFISTIHDFCFKLASQLDLFSVQFIKCRQLAMISLKRKNVVIKMLYFKCFWKNMFFLCVDSISGKICYYFGPGRSSNMLHGVTQQLCIPLTCHYSRVR